MIQRTASSDSDTGEGKVIIHYHGQSTEITGTYIIYYRTQCNTILYTYGKKISSILKNARFSGKGRQSLHVIVILLFC